MKYTQPSFSVPPADLRNGTNRHGQTWEDIWDKPKRKPRRIPAEPTTLAEFLAHKPHCPCAYCVKFRKEAPEMFPDLWEESVPDATGDSTAEHTNATGHTCNGTYKTFSAAHCPYCWSEHGR